jgi:hypothetical protein
MSQLVTHYSLFCLAFMHRCLQSGSHRRRHRPPRSQLDRNCSTKHQSARLNLRQSKLTFDRIISSEPAEQPSIGSAHEWVIIAKWPVGVTFTERNVFKATRPLPVVKHGDEYYGVCGCTSTCRDINGNNTQGCINVATCTICDDSNCSAGITCGNRFLPQFALNIFECSVGCGAVTEETIPAGAFVTEYVGELLYGIDAKARHDKRYLVEMPTKLPDNNVLYVDARFFGNASRFVNHSCEPNCELQEWRWGNTTRLGLFALRHIAALTELSFCYRGREVPPFSCQCGAHLCLSKRS